MLTQLRSLLRSQAAMSVPEIARQLQVPVTVAQSLCDYWLAKGHVERLLIASPCQNCAACADRQHNIWYRWRQQHPMPAPPALNSITCYLTTQS
jgi:hypothetical protein